METWRDAALWFVGGSLALVVVVAALIGVLQKRRRRREIAAHWRAEQQHLQSSDL
jgi:hypothetical protein